MERFSFIQKAFKHLILLSARVVYY